MEGPFLLIFFFSVKKENRKIIRKDFIFINNLFVVDSTGVCKFEESTIERLNYNSFFSLFFLILKKKLKILTIQILQGEKKKKGKKFILVIYFSKLIFCFVSFVD